MWPKPRHLAWIRRRRPIHPSRRQRRTGRHGTITANPPTGSRRLSLSKPRLGRPRQRPFPGHRALPRAADGLAICRIQPLCSAQSTRARRRQLLPRAMGRRPSSRVRHPSLRRTPPGRTRSSQPPAQSRLRPLPAARCPRNFPLVESLNRRRPPPGHSLTYGTPPATHGRLLPKQRNRQGLPPRSERSRPVKSCRLPRRAASSACRREDRKRPPATAPSLPCRLKPLRGHKAGPSPRCKPSRRAQCCGGPTLRDLKPSQGKGTRRPAAKASGLPQRRLWPRRSKVSGCSRLRWDRSLPR